MERIKCNNCGNLTSFTKEDFDDDKDLSEVYCSEECKYNAETGNPGKEY